MLRRDVKTTKRDGLISLSLKKKKKSLVTPHNQPAADQQNFVSIAISAQALQLITASYQRGLPVEEPELTFPV